MASPTAGASPKVSPLWHLLGEPEIPWRGRDLTLLLGAKAVGLIAYLALAPHGVARDELARLLWPPTETARSLARARHNLRRRLVTLHKAFGEDYDSVFEDVDDRLRLRTDTIKIDVLRLCEIEDGRTAPAELDELCRGPFLQGLTTRSRPFDDWAEEKRGRFAVIARPLLASAWAAAVRAGDWPLAARLDEAMGEFDISRPDLPAPEVRSVAPTPAPPWLGDSPTRDQEPEDYGGERRRRDNPIRERNAALRALARDHFGELPVLDRAREVAKLSKRYETTFWPRDSRVDEVPARYHGTPKEHLWRAFKSGARMPLSERRLRSLLRD